MRGSPLMKSTISAWSGWFTAVILAIVLATPTDASAQHQAVPRSGGGGQPSGGTSSGSGGGSSGGSKSGGESGGTSRGAHRAPTGDTSTRSTGSGRSAEPRDEAGGNSGGDTVAPITPAPGASRPRNGQPKTGDAVVRETHPPVPGDGTVVFVPGWYYGNYYPWGYGGFGVAGYYGGYYDPWYYDTYQGYYNGDSYDGRLRLKVKPRNAEVFVDGYFAGV